MPIIERNGRVIIPSIHNLATLDAAIDAPPSVILLADVHLGNVGPLARKCKGAGHKVLVRPDLIQGLKSDKRGITLLKQEFAVDGAFTGSASTARLAHQAGLEVYWRFFLLDTRSLDSAAHQMNTMPWDGFEIAPGPMALQCAEVLVSSAASKPLIAGGFVSSLDMVNALFDAGYSAINTSDRSLWPSRTQTVATPDV
ncbi:glycerol-3-phosphate responsive antiterminator [Flaviflexus huanghaiensis]|uniref:glycerol-3-phosphate responsive antiterminator n=1 Tax=Flaviflexus huanghaiensis TaxID=1111473 RepID=UPI0015F7D36A